MVLKVGGPVPRVPMVVAPMLILLLPQFVGRSSGDRITIINLWYSWVRNERSFSFVI